MVWWDNLANAKWGIPLRPGVYATFCSLVPDTSWATHRPHEMHGVARTSPLAASLRQPTPRSGPPLGAASRDNPFGIYQVPAGMPRQQPLPFAGLRCV